MPDTALDSGLQCLVAIARHHGLSTSVEQIRRGHLPVSAQAAPQGPLQAPLGYCPSLAKKPTGALLNAAASLGLKARHSAGLS